MSANFGHHEVGLGKPQTRPSGLSEDVLGGALNPHEVAYGLRWFFFDVYPAAMNCLYISLTLALTRSNPVGLASPLCWCSMAVWELGWTVVLTLDCRIGMLQRAGGPAYYAFKGQEYAEGSPADLLEWLDGNALSPRSTRSAKPPVPRKRAQIREYTVRVEMKYPAWNDRPFDKVVFARTARDAEKDVREWMFREGHTRFDGPLILKASRVID